MPPPESPLQVDDLLREILSYDSLHGHRLFPVPPLSVPGGVGSSLTPNFSGDSELTTVNPNC
jgi:hypothetical protein